METSLIGVAVSEELEVRHECARYRPLGLLANPFLVHHSESGWDGRDFEVAAASNLLLGAVETAAAQETAKPIVVSKTDAVPAYYSLRAVGLAERPDTSHCHNSTSYSLWCNRASSTNSTVPRRLVHSNSPT